VYSKLLTTMSTQNRDVYDGGYVNLGSRGIDLILLYGTSTTTAVNNQFLKQIKITEFDIFICIIIHLWYRKKSWNDSKEFEIIIATMGGNHIA